MKDIFKNQFLSVSLLTCFLLIPSCKTYKPINFNTIHSSVVTFDSDQDYKVIFTKGEIWKVQGRELVIIGDQIWNRKPPSQARATSEILDIQVAQNNVGKTLGVLGAILVSGAAVTLGVMFFPLF